MAGQWDHEVVVIGGGMSGICMGVTLRREGIEDFVILEKSEDVGGTWLDNSYPGACCDVPSFSYCFSLRHHSITMTGYMSPRHFYPYQTA